MGTLTIRGTGGFSAVPLGPFRTVFQQSSPSDLAELAELVAHELAAYAVRQGIARARGRPTGSR